MLNINKNEDRGVVRKHDIIQAIIESDLSAVESALLDNPNCVNDFHEQSGMNAPMLAAQSAMPTYLEQILAYSGNLNFGTVDRAGRDLLTVAYGSKDREIIEMTTEAYERHASHVLNNWPEP